MVRQGVPQGSVLGPLLFLIYINDLATLIKKYATPIPFADDTSAIISISNVNNFENSLNLVINVIENWCKNNFLTLNLKKTQFMQFVTNHKKIINLQVKVKDFSLLNTNNIKFLGITLDNKLMWKTYGSELSIKLNKACYAIRAIKSFVSQKALIAVYYSYFHSLLKYGIIFWGNSPVNRDIQDSEESHENLFWEKLS